MYNAHFVARRKEHFYSCISLLIIATIVVQVSEIRRYLYRLAHRKWSNILKILWGKTLAGRTLFQTVGTYYLSYLQL